MVLGMLSLPDVCTGMVLSSQVNCAKEPVVKSLQFRYPVQLLQSYNKGSHFYVSADKTEGIHLCYVSGTRKGGGLKTVMFEKNWLGQGFIWTECVVIEEEEGRKWKKKRKWMKMKNKKRRMMTNKNKRTN